MHGAINKKEILFCPEFCMLYMSAVIFINIIMFK